MTFRAARAEDAAAAAPLVFASGEREFRFFLGVSADECVAFLRDAFALSAGRFSWQRHRVALDASGTVIGVIAAHDGRDMCADDAHIAWTLLRYFGSRRTVPMLLRGLVLEQELPKPKRSQTRVAHCAVAAAMRGTGVFCELFGDARRAGMRGLAGESDEREIVLDVLVSNTRAAALYRRLGFVEVARRRLRSRRLPVDLESIRMRFSPRMTD
ncbi:N-acetyltransferase [Paraburkholderia denitrificans]|uniref:N-acetyltransferase n=1 Tax=Paraburkholderia denitrificans TaxID=694025 RepID=A0ABW0JB30_9BURK